MKMYYTKEQCDLIWSQFAHMVANQLEVVDMQKKWDEMAKKSALKEKILKELRSK